jgi:hypothetical protein
MRIIRFYCQPLHPDQNYPLIIRDINSQSDDEKPIITTLQSRTEHDYYRQLLLVDSHLIIFCPGSQEDVKRVRQDLLQSAGSTDNCKWTQKLPWTFVADLNFGLTRSLGLFAADQWSAWPAILAARTGDLQLQELCIGRGPGYYGHDHLLEYLKHFRHSVAEKQIPMALRRLDGWINALRMITEIIAASCTAISKSHLPYLPPEIRCQIFSHLQCKYLMELLSSVDRLWCRYAVEYVYYRLEQLLLQIKQALERSASVMELNDLCVQVTDELKASRYTHSTHITTTIP